MLRESLPSHEGNMYAVPSLRRVVIPDVLQDLMFEQATSAAAPTRRKVGRRRGRWAHSPDMVGICLRQARWGEVLAPLDTVIGVNARRTLPTWTETPS